MSFQSGKHSCINTFRTYFFFLSLSFPHQYSNIPIPTKEVIVYFLDSLLDCGQRAHIFSKPQSNIHGLTISNIFVIRMDLEKSKMNNLPNYIHWNLNKTKHWVILEVGFFPRKKQKWKKANLIFCWSNLRFLSERFFSYEISNLKICKGST